MRSFGVRTEYEDPRTRHCITVWSGPFYHTFEAEGLSLPKNAGYMLTTYNGGKVRVACPAPRDDENYQEVDAAISVALAEHYQKIGARCLIEEGS